MLHLEKNRQGISVNIRDRQCLINRTFVFALSLALGLHLSAALLFNVQHFISFGDAVLPPTIVEADPGYDEIDSSILAYLDRMNTQSRYSLEPKSSNLMIPSLSMETPARQMEHIKELSVIDNPFLIIEEDWQHLITIETPSIPSLQVNVSGTLAGKLLDDGSHTMLSYSDKPYRMVYDVRVEAKTGEIFWYVPIHPIESLQIQKVATTLLDHMRFETDSLAFVYAGEVEIIFTPG